MIEEKCEVDMKGTIVKIFRTEEPELSQEEAIINFGEIKNKKASNNDDDTLEDEEHLKRVKQELLASLNKVKELEKALYGNSKSNSNRKELKIEKSTEKTKIVERANEEKSIDKDIEQKERE